jgi:hypothetical protein
MATNKHIPGGYKGFLALHAEKIVLGVCVALVALFFCLGYGIETIPANQNPAALYVQVEEAKAYIAKDSWEDLRDSRSITPNHLERAQRSRKPIDGDYYAMEQYWLWPKFPLNEKRRKPTIYKPTDVVAWATVAPVAEPLREGAVNRLDQLPPAREAVHKEKPKPAPKRRPRRSDDEFSDDLDLDEDLSEDDLGDDLGDELGDEPTLGAAKVLSRAQRDEIVQGTYQIRGMGDTGVVGRTIVAVTCLVPYGKQREEFDDCFVNAMNYSPKRDRPEYFYFVAERKPAGAPEDSWKVVSDTGYMLRLARHWAEIETEDPVDESHRNPALTAPVLPALLQPVRKLATNPKIPIKTEEDLRREAEALASRDAGSEPLDPLAPGELGGPRALGQPDTLPPVDDGSGGDVLDGDEFDGDEATDLDMEDDFSGDDFSGGDFSGEAELKQYADQLLVRFYDLRAERGETYQYRVRVFLRDPNNPIPGGAAKGEDLGGFDPNNVGRGHAPVPERALADDAMQQVRESREKNQYYVATDFSDPSPPVKVPDLPLRLVAGAVDAPRYTPVDNGRVLRDEAKAEVLAVTWSDEFGIFIPGLANVARGALLNFTTNANVLHPLRMALKSLEQHDFKTDAVLLDIRGGENLGTSSSPLYTPGEVLLLDRDGNLIVRNEIDDAEVYRRQLFIEDRGDQDESSYDDSGLDGDLDGDLGDDLGGGDLGGGLDDDF